MRVIDGSTQGGANEAAHVTAIFGAGLVGHNIASHLSARTSAEQSYLPFDWTPTEARAEQIKTIERDLLNRVSTPAATNKRISIVWSAGAAGFSAPQEVLDAEIVSFKRVIELCQSLCTNKLDIALDFHLLSSAGGLFEGQRDVDAKTVPNPMRPYATTKLLQEGMVKALPQDITAHIYRPSTIYGYHSGGRPGLIITLIRNGYQRRTTSIFGNPDTMRDFVHVSDISRFIGDRIITANPKGGTILLARGEPTSMRSVIMKVEDIIGHRLYLQYDPRPSNAQHNTYRPSATRHMTNSVSLGYGVKLCAMQWFEKEFGHVQG